MTDLSNTTEFLQACWRCFVLGLVQGLTEFLPISSTAHLKALPVMIGWEDPGLSVIAVIQLGSILAVIAYFKKDLIEIIQGFSFAFKRGQWREPNAQLCFAICVGTLPILLAGMSIKYFWHDFEGSSLRSLPSIAIVSITMAGLLSFAEAIGKRKKNLKNVSGKEGLIVGLGQMLALVPGVSRSGITLSSALINGWQRQDAARFSFLLGIPAITFAGLVELKDAFHSELNPGGLPLLIGIASATTFSWLSIDWLLKYLQKHSTFVFIIYRILFGVVLLIWWWKFSSN